MKRARDDADRHRRRAAILTAADRLIRDGGGDLPSVAQIATAADVAKGTVYVYFCSKEEILAALLSGLWQPAFAAFEEEILDLERPLEERTAAFSERFVRYCEDHVHLLRLDAIAKEIIERNVDPAALALHKRPLHASIMATGDRMERVLGLPPGRGLHVLVRLHALMRGLWLSFGDPVPGLPDCTFSGELQEATAEYLRGALSKDR